MSKADDLLRNFIRELSYNAATNHVNYNGADFYLCPTCLQRTNIKGYGGGATGIHLIEHDDWCTLLKNYNEALEYLESLDGEDEVE